MALKKLLKLIAIVASGFPGNKGFSGQSLYGNTELAEMCIRDSPLGARSLDGVKRRTRAGMGRCQAGFCSPRTMEILSRELSMDMEEITKCGGDSKIVVGTNKDRI